MTNSVQEIITIKHRAAIAGYVTDAITGKGIAGAVVEVVEQNLETLTRGDGFYYFLDLEGGPYGLNILVPQASRRIYGGSEDKPTTTIQEIVINSDGKPVFDLKAYVSLVPTSLVGTIKCQGEQNNTIPLSNAIVKLRGSEIQTLTNKDGKYLLSGIAAGSYIIQFSAKDIATSKEFATQTQPVTLTVGQETIAETVFLKLSARMTGTVTSKNTNKPIPMALVKLVDRQGQQTLTDHSGKYVLSDLLLGKVTVEVSARGFETTNPETVELTAGSEVSKEFSLSMTLPRSG